jgi:hypothetical protein
LNESADDQELHVAGGRAHQAEQGDRTAPHGDDRLDRIKIGDASEREIGERDAQNDGRYGPGGARLVNPEFLPQDRQDRLDQIDRRKAGRNQKEDGELQPEGFAGVV